MAFKLMEEPMAVQMSVHVSNLKNTYGDSVIKAFIDTLDGGMYVSLTVEQLIEYYGIEYCKQWFAEFYGVKFKSEVA